jgi:excinuclease UvrABC nuclease subunit
MIPREILTEENRGQRASEDWLTEKRGSSVKITYRSGDKKALLDLQNGCRGDDKTLDEKAAIGGKRTRQPIRPGG